MTLLERLATEPPVRLLSYAFVKKFSRSVSVLNRWGAVDRPAYLAGVFAAARLAKKDGIPAISVLEFGVAGGRGLLALQDYSARVEEATGVKIRVYGFDTGEGLPQLCGDYRDHPDRWKESDYKMDSAKLRAKLAERTNLILGNIRDTIPAFVASTPPPTGFIACDVDLYSSTTDVLRFLSLSGRQILRRVFMYFDDVALPHNHRFAGELLAIDEFNRDTPTMKIDIWRGFQDGRAFRDEPWSQKMFIAHDLEAITRFALARPASGRLSLDK